MALDFSALAAPKTVIVPVLDKRFQYNRKKYELEVDDGWWVALLEGNKAKAIEPHVWVDDPKNMKVVNGYTYNNQLIFQNFDAAKRAWNISISASLHFNIADTFSPVKAIAWETNQFFYIGINYSEIKMYDAKMAYDNEENLDSIKGITPEIRTLFLFHSLERDQLRELLRQKEINEENEKRMKDIPYRLMVTLERAGARLLGYSSSGNRLIVDWELIDGQHTYNSVIDANTWMVVEAGYCLSGGDKKLNLTSLAKTAEDYEERNVIFITRH